MWEEFYRLPDDLKTGDKFLAYKKVKISTGGTVNVWQVCYYKIEGQKWRLYGWGQLMGMPTHFRRLTVPEHA